MPFAASSQRACCHQEEHGRERKAQLLAEDCQPDRQVRQLCRAAHRPVISYSGCLCSKAGFQFSAFVNWTIRSRSRALESEASDGGDSANRVPDLVGQKQGSIHLEFELDAYLGRSRSTMHAPFHESFPDDCGGFALREIVPTFVECNLNRFSR